MCAVLLFLESEHESVSRGGESGSTEQQNEGRLFVNETALGLQPGRRFSFADLESALHVICQIPY